MVEVEQEQGDVTDSHEQAFCTSILHTLRSKRLDGTAGLVRAKKNREKKYKDLVLLQMPDTKSGKRLVGRQVDTGFQAGRNEAALQNRAARERA
jgi:hypothetical protein